MKEYNLESYDFDLPEDLIAKFPIVPRDNCKLLTFVNNQLKDDIFYNIIDYLNEGDVLVMNNSKVIKANLKGLNNKGQSININLIKYKNNKIWEAFIKPAKKVKLNDIITISNEFKLELVFKDNNSGLVHLKSQFELDEFMKQIETNGQMPIPPYLKREANKDDDILYQTIYANKEGSVAAPTAGLHFTNDLLDKIEKKGIKICYVTLHVGAGTFLPVKSNNILEHQMHEEYYEIDEYAENIINNAKQQNKNIIAVGTTSLRTIESNIRKYSKIKASCENTDIFIYPGQKILSANLLITNFHLPKSTLFMLICAFSGFENMHKLYSYAIKEKYRFFSYGDACLLRLNNN